MIRQAVRAGQERSSRIADYIVPLSMVLVIGSVFAAGVLGPIPLRYLLAWLLAGTAILVEFESPRAGLRRALLVMVPVWTAAASFYCAFVSPFDPSDNDALFRYVLLYPLGAVLGAILVLGRHRAWLGRTIIGWAVLSSVLAVVELLGGVHLFAWLGASDRPLRDGFLRAVVLSEHPVVLATLVVVALPFLWATKVRLRVALGLSAVLVGGVFATMSRGGLVLVVVFLAVFLTVRRWPPSGPGRPSVRILISIATLLVLAVVLVLSGFLNANLLVSDNPETASLQYRLVLYQKVLDSLMTQPWGWGLGGLPPDVYLVSSPFGVHDLSVTVDSELALLAFDAGVVGVVLYAAGLGFLASRWVLASEIGQAALLLILSGLYLALHAWTGLGLITLMLVGAALAEAWRRRREHRSIDRAETADTS